MLATGLTPDQKGAIAEAEIATAAMKLGVGVFRPLSDGERYDLIFDLHPRLLRVQCKWASRHGDVIVVPFYSSRRAPEGFRRRSYVADEVDAIAAYCFTLDRTFLLPVEEIPRKTYAQLRVAPCRNNQQAFVNWASDYEFAATLERLTGP